LLSYFPLSLHWESLDKHRSKSEENLNRAFDYFERELGVPRTSAALSLAPASSCCVPI
jgi:hypothetical protein